MLGNERCIKRYKTRKCLMIDFKFSTILDDRKIECNPHQQLKNGFTVRFKIPSVMHIWEIEEGNQSMMEKFVCPAHGFLYIMSLFVNFRLQVLFVSQNVSIPFGDGLHLTNPNFLSHLE